MDLIAIAMMGSLTLLADRLLTDELKIPTIDVAVAVVTQFGKVLIAQRKAGDSFGGYWEFPGGKCEAGETIEIALLRELREELAIVVRPIHPLTPILHRYRRAFVRLHPFMCDLIDGEPQMIECQAIEWVDPNRLRDYRFPPANESLLAEVAAWMADRP